MNWTAVGPDTYLLGESPFWHPHEQTLYWVDIPGKKILRANVYMGSVQTWDMPSEPGCIAPMVGGGLVVVVLATRAPFLAALWSSAATPAQALFAVGAVALAALPAWMMVRHDPV